MNEPYICPIILSGCVVYPDVHLQLGSREQLPARGSHRSGRAQFGHPAPRAMESLRNGKHCVPHAMGGADGARPVGQISPTSSEHARNGG
jgi:hypothetical protein